MPHYVFILRIIFVSNPSVKCPFGEKLWISSSDPTDGGFSFLQTNSSSSLSEDEETLRVSLQRPVNSGGAERVDMKEYDVLVVTITGRYRAPACVCWSGLALWETCYLSSPGPQPPMHAGTGYSNGKLLWFVSPLEQQGRLSASIAIKMVPSPTRYAVSHVHHIQPAFELFITPSIEKEA